MSSEYTHACTHPSIHRNERFRNPLFTFSVQSDVLEIKRKGEGGRGGGENHMGVKEKRKPHFLSLPTFFLSRFLVWFFFSSFQARVVTLTNDDA